MGLWTVHLCWACRGWLAPVAWLDIDREELSVWGKTQVFRRRGLVSRTETNEMFGLAGGLRVLVALWSRWGMPMTARTEEDWG